jgi:tRNA A-37 threonylcarbamoyl transferase component Bud32
LALAGVERPSLAGYEILGVIGKGGMGIVYKARHAKLDRMVAIKVLPPGAGSDPTFTERFTREARALARLNHPNILAVYDFGQVGEEPYFVMEYVEGTDLRQRLRTGPLPPGEALQVAGRICEALQYAHEEGVVHRDIKPENVLIDKRGRVKIADFGIAKLLKGRTAQFTLTGPWQVVGTLRYMAPEQMDNPLGLDHRADVFSLGVVLYEMLTGELPLGRFPPPSHKAPVGEQVDEVVLRALEKEPERRYQQAGEMKAAVEGLRTELPGAEAAAAPLPAEPNSAAVGSQETVPHVADDSARATQKVIRRVNKAASLLLTVGSLGLLISLALLFTAIILAVESHASFVGVALLTAGPAVSGLIIWGALGMLHLRSYRRAAVGCMAAALPLSPVWLVSVWVGIGAWLILREPGVKAAFAEQERGWLERFLRSSTGWTTLLLLAGMGFLLPALLDGELSSGGTLLFVAFLGLLALLLGTDFLDPLPVWRPIVIVLGGLLTVLLIVHSFNQQHVHYDDKQWVIRRHAVDLLEKGLLAVGAGVLLVGIVELRRTLMRWQKPKA